MYEVLSGTYDEFNGKLEVSVKYAAEFADFPSALEAYDSQGTRAWAALYMGDRVILGSSP